MVISNALVIVFLLFGFGFFLRLRILLVEMTEFGSEVGHARLFPDGKDFARRVREIALAAGGRRDLRAFSSAAIFR